MKRAQNQMNKQYQQQNSSPKKEGEINVTQTSKSKAHGEKEKLGDYVDFEEIKDDKPKQ